MHVQQFQVGLRIVRPQFEQIAGLALRSVLAWIGFLDDLSRLTDFLGDYEAFVLGNHVRPAVRIVHVAGSADEPPRIGAHGLVLPRVTRMTVVQ